MDSLSNIVTRAKAVQGRHQGWLDYITENLEQEQVRDDAVLRRRVLDQAEDGLASLRRAYWEIEVDRNAPTLSIPAALTADPDQAVIARVYFDIGLTEQRLRDLKAQGTTLSVFRKQVEPVKAPGLPDLGLPDLDKLLRQLLEWFKKLGKGAVVVLILAGLVWMALAFSATRRGK